MSVNYSCNQFEKAYKPTRLGNWEVPKWHLNRPKGRSTVTKVIANDRGHLLPGVQKTDQKHWAGLYLGTYQLPKRITKDIVQELIAPKCQSYMKRSYHQPILESKQEAENKCNNNTLKGLNANEERKIDDQEEDKESIKTVKTTVSNSSKRTSMSNCSGRGRRNPSEQQLFNSTLPEYVTTPSRAHSSPALSRISGDENKDHGHGRSKHHRLPDTIEDAVYRSLQMKRDKHPGLGLDGFWPKCSAVAYKSFNDPGPTQCSKLRVYRPKTSRDDGNDRRDAENGRPKTCGSQALTDIKLALCWDLDAPFDGRRSADKPAVFHKIVKKDSAEIHSGKPPPRAPNSSAVMGFVRPDEPESRVSRPRNLSAIVNLIPGKLAENNEMRGEPEPDPAETEQTPSAKSPASREKTPEAIGNVVDKPEQSDRDEGKTTGANEFDGREKQHCRPCVACDCRYYAAAKRCQKSHGEKTQYKMAFKAGVPVTSPVKHRNKCKKKLKVPKPKTTNSDKKKYVIGTLLPPFSMWPGTTARDYPEHWRLTSVYRQAFKPLESRKQPFLDTIYL